MRPLNFIVATTSVMVLAACGTSSPPTLSRTLDSAIVFLEHRLADRPGDIVTPALLADRYMIRFGRDRDIADVARAERVLRQGLATHPSHVPFVGRMTGVHIARHEFPEALAAAKTTVDQTRRASDHGPLFDAWFEVGAYDSAVAALNRMDPSSFGYNIRHARLAEQQGDLDTAERAMARACGDPSSMPRTLAAWCATRLASLEAAAGRWNRSEEWFGRALEAVPDYPAALSGLADVAFRRGDLEQARTYYLRVAREGVDPGVLLELARLAAYDGDAELAKSYRAAFENGTDDPRYGRAYWSPRAEQFARAGRIEAALDLARRDVAQRPSPEAFHTLAVVLLAKGDVTGARQAITKVFTWGPGSPEALYHAGLIALAEQRRVEGREYLRRALDDPAGLPPDLATAARAASSD